MSPEDSSNGDVRYSTETTRATRLKADTERDFIDYRDERGLTDAEALRRLTRQALDDSTVPRLPLQLAALIAILAYFWSIYSGSITAAIIVLGAFAGGVAIYSTLPDLKRLKKQLLG
jgi:hypothetical protein